MRPRREAAKKARIALNQAIQDERVSDSDWAGSVGVGGVVAPGRPLNNDDHSSLGDGSDAGALSEEDKASDVSSFHSLSSESDDPVPSDDDTESDEALAETEEQNHGRTSNTTLNDSVGPELQGPTHLVLGEGPEPLREAELYEANLQIASPSNPLREGWASPIQLVAQYSKDLGSLAAIVAAVGTLTSEAQVQNLLNDSGGLFPVGSGWIEPILPQFRAARGAKTVLFILQCPQREERASPLKIEGTCLTNQFIGAFVQYLQTHGICALIINLRKECRRTDDGSRCPFIEKEELQVCGLATVGEIFVALNVFNVEIIATIAISQSAALGLDAVEAFLDDKAVLGNTFRALWHPRIIVDHFKALGAVLTRRLMKMMILKDIVPALCVAVGALGHPTPTPYNVWAFLWQCWSLSSHHTLYTVFTPATLAPLDSISLSDLRDVNDEVMRRLKDEESLLGQGWRLTGYVRNRNRAALRVFNFLDGKSAT